MIVYLSLKQILLNQIAVLIRKKSDKNNDDPERLQKRLTYLQQALEQIKSYEHNSNFQYVIKHFNINLSESEQQEIHALSEKYDDFSGSSPHKKRISKSGFTTQRSETLFTGASEEQYDNFYGGVENEMDDEKTSKNTNPQWIHYKGYAHWLKKQSFIKFKKRNDHEKYRKIWNTILGLKLIDGWNKKRIKPKNIIGPYGTSHPYIAIHECGTRDIVKASLLRLSITQNRIFKFNINHQDKTKNNHSRARRSIDMDNEDDYDDNEYQLNANQLIKGKNLFNQVQNKDVLRIVATMLWDKNLANNVLEELLHNPRFSMYGIHAKNIADTLAKEYNLGTMSSYDTEQTPNLEEQQQTNNQQQQQQQEESQKSQEEQEEEEQVKTINSAHQYDPAGTGPVEQFALPSPQRAVSLQKMQKKQKQINENEYVTVESGNVYSKPSNKNTKGNKGNKGALYNPQYNQYNNSYATNNNNNYASNTTFSFNRANKNNNDNNNNNNKNTANNYNGNPMSDHARYYEQQKQHQQHQQQQQQHHHQQHQQYQQQQQQQQHQQHQQQQQQQQQQQYKYNNNNNNNNNKDESMPEQHPEPKPVHKPHSASVVFHDNIRDSEINDYGADHEYDNDQYQDGDDEDDSVSNASDIPQNH